MDLEEVVRINLGFLDIMDTLWSTELNRDIGLI